MLANCDSGYIRVRRVDKARTFINRFLYDNGQMLFEHAAPPEKGESEKRISVLILGLGKCGGEMLKALSWYCQIDGYRLSIDAVDISPFAEDKLRAECPELLDSEHNGVRAAGEAEYYISFHSGVDFRSTEFEKIVSGLPETTFAFVALGKDSDNIEACVKLRGIFERAKARPDICAVLRNSDKKQAVMGVRNFKGQEYNIDSIGDIPSVFTEKEIIHSEIEEEALKLHLEWGVEEVFWRYEYNHRASIARAIHRRARIACGQLNSDVPYDRQTPEKREKSGILEHKRWNAFTRAAGYRYSGSTDKSSRNDLGLIHNDLVSYNLLSDRTKKKDRDISVNK